MSKNGFLISEAVGYLAEVTLSHRLLVASAVGQIKGGLSAA